jgi:hypothetical protein
MLSLAEEQAVLPLVGRALARELRHATPAQLGERFARATQAQASRSLAQATLLLDILASLDRSELQALPFKGPTLALQAYGDLGARSFADLDFLVRGPDLAAVRALLLEMGFLPTYPSTPSRRALLVRRGSHESFERDGALVELHWRIASPISDFALDYERLWRRLGTLRIGDQIVPALRPDDLLMILTLHGTKHAWERLGWICDVAELVRAAPDLDWDNLVAEMERMECERPLRLCLRLAQELLDAPLPSEISARVHADRSLPPLVAHVRDHLFLPPRSGAGTFGFHLRTREGLSAKLALALGSLTAINQRDLEVVSLPDAVLPLYFLTRPLRLAGKGLAHVLRGPRPG